ncbi:MAG: hypothetical protein QME68_07835, partial [Elusimicrobiota bacterium]|nr:hypothetical protein [Elusimicrobiota bacterium]
MLKKILITHLLSIVCIFSSSNIYSLTDTTPLQQGIKFLEAGEFNRVEEILTKLSSTTSEDYYHLSALYYMYRGEYETALKLLEKIQLTGDKLNLFIYLQKLFTICSSFTEYEFDKFKLRLTNHDTILKSYIRDIFEEIHTKIGETFNFTTTNTTPNEKILIEVYSTKEDFAFASTLGSETVERSGAIGICKFNRIMIVSPRCLPQGYRWLDSICHEYIHFVVNRLTKNNCSLWLHEGIAKYYETIWRSTSPVYITPGKMNILFDALTQDKLIPFERMSPSLVYLKNQDEVALAFAEVASAIEFITRKFPAGTIGKLLKVLSTTTEEKAFKEVLQVDTKEFEKLYLADLRRQKGRVIVKTPGAQIDKILWTKVGEYDEVQEFVGLS